jgi:hypothetical protein
MFERENSIGAAQLEAEGLEGVFNIAKLIAELAAQMAQRDIQVEDLIIQTDRGTLRPGMDSDEAQQFEADIRDVFMDPENKKAFRVFMEDPDGNRTLIFESKEGKIAPDLYDLRRSMMQFYAKTDAEQFGKEFDEYFDEVVIKTGKAEEQAALGGNGDEPDLDPRNATIDAASSAPDGPAPDLDPRNATIDTAASTTGLVSHINPNTDSMVAQAAADAPPTVDLSSPTVSPAEVAAPTTSADSSPRGDLSDPAAITAEHDELDTVDSADAVTQLDTLDSADIQAAMFTQKTQQEQNEALIMAAIAPTLIEANVDLTDSTIDVVAHPETYKHVEPVASADIQAAMFTQQTQQEKNEAFIMAAIAPTLREANGVIDENLRTAESLTTEYSGVEGVRDIETFLQDVQQLGEQITEIQSQMNVTADGSIALALSGAGELEGWGESVQTTLVSDLPNISDRLQALSQRLVEYIRERAIQDLNLLKDSITEKFTDAVDTVSDKFSTTVESISEFVRNEIDDVELLLLGGREKINDAIDSLVDKHGEDGILEGDKYLLEAEYHSITRKEDNEVIYINGYIDKSATQEDRQAIKDIPAIAKEQSQQASETQSAGASAKR